MDKRLDQLCDQFEHDWKSGKAPRIEDWLVQVTDADQQSLLRELIALEVEFRKARGEIVSLNDYEGRFAEHRDLVGIAFQSLDSAQVAVLSEHATVDAPFDTQSTFSPTNDLPTDCDQKAAEPEGKPLVRLTPDRPRGDLEGETLPYELGNYRLIKCLGEGGMGTVYEAIDLENGNRVALKTMKTVLPTSLALFKKEFHTLAGITHRNLATLGFLDTRGGFPFFTMELVDGVSFRDYVRAGYDSDAVRGGSVHCDLNRLRDALRQLAEGVHALHVAKKLHRDLKSSNVMVSSDGIVKILDFGLAVEIADNAFRNSIREVAGTYSYMSPEQHGARQLTPASDWYSVGVMLYESLAGKLPFEGPCDELARLKRLGHSESLQTILPSVPSDLAQLCMDLLSPDPRKRPSGQEVLRRLRGSVPMVPTSVWIGRQSELQTLQDAYETARLGEPTLLMVQGESGMGKSALMSRFFDQLQLRQSVVILRGRCYENESVPYKVFDGLVDSLAAYLRRLSSDEVKMVCPLHPASLCRIFPVFDDVPDFKAIAKQDKTLSDPQENRRRGFAALRELFFRLARFRKLVLFVDDVQWGDKDSARLLAELIRLPDAPPFLFVCAFRSEDAETSDFLSDLWQQTNFPKARVELLGESSGGGEFLRPLHLHIGPLSHQDAVRMAGDLLPLGTTSEQAELIGRESRGVPLFLQILAQSAEPDTGDELSEAIALLPRTVSLESVLLRRVSALTGDQRMVLDLIALAGRPLTRSTLDRAVGVTDNSIVLYNQLRSLHLVKSVGGDQGQAQEAFHDYVRTTVRKHIPQERIVELSRRLADALEANVGHGDSQMLAALYRDAGDAIKAGSYFAKAAAEAQDALAFSQAAEFYQQAIETLRPSGQQEGDLRESLGDALSHAGRTAEAAQQYILAAAKVGRDKAADLQCRAALRFLTSGHIDQGLATLKRVLASEEMRLPNSPTRTIISLLWHRLRLRLRGLDFKPRTPDQVNAKDRRQVEVCWAAAAGLSLVDPVLAADFGSRTLLLALRIGEPQLLQRSLALQTGHLAIGGLHSRKVVARYLRKTCEVGRLTDGAFTRGTREQARGITAHLQGRWRAAVKSCDRAADYFLDKSCRDVAWDLDTANTFSMWALTYAGNVTELTRRQPDLLRQAHQNQDLFAILNFGTIVAAYFYLGADRPGELRQHLASDREKLSQKGFFVQHHNWLLASTFLELYEGNGMEAWSLIRNGWRNYSMSFLGRVQQVRIDFLQMRTRAALAAANQASDPSFYLAKATRDIRRLHRERAPWAVALAKLFQACLVGIQGNQVEAQRQLLAANGAMKSVDMELAAFSALRQAGQFAATDQKETVFRQANQEAQRLSIKNPSQMAWAFVPLGTFTFPSSVLDETFTEPPSRH